MKRSFKAFLWISLAIVLLEFVIVVYGHETQEEQLEETLYRKLAQVQSSFELAYAGSRQRMLELASYVAANPEIQQAFLAGRRAVEREGGGAGGAAAAAARQKLLALSQQSWQELESRFDFRQMQFHIPPSATSFLRVHAPEEYGDDLSSIRHTIVNANNQQIMTSGFEVGRAHSGIRGAAPVFADDAESGERVHVGTLEFGTSLKQMLSSLTENQTVSISVLVNLDHLKQIVWPGFLREKVRQNGNVQGYLIEETTLPRTEIVHLLDHARYFLNDKGYHPHSHDGSYHWMAAFPLRDYLGESDPQRPPVGLVVATLDASAELAAVHQNLRTSTLIAVVGFLAFEVILVLILKLTTEKLERLVEKGRAELKDVNQRLRVEHAQKEGLIEELQTALDDVRILEGLLPICSYCKKIRDDFGSWERLESYIENKTAARFSHGICDDCMTEHFSDAVEIDEKVEPRLSFAADALTE